MEKWKTLPQNAGNISRQLIDGDSYQVLASTFSNELDEHAALFEKKDLQMALNDSNTIKLTFIDLSQSQQRYFGIYLYYLNAQQYLYLGYNQQEWVLEYRTPHTHNKQTSKQARPELRSKSHLLISLKNDGQLNILFNDADLFETINIGSEVLASLQESANIYLALGTSGYNRTTIGMYEEAAIIDWATMPKDEGEVVSDDAVEYDRLTNDRMTVTIDRAFPRVKAYQMADQTLWGQVKPLTTMAINQYTVTPTVTYHKNNDQQATYVLDIDQQDLGIKASLTVDLKLEENQLHFNVTDIYNHYEVVSGQEIDDPRHLIQEIAFPDNFLLAVSSDQEKAEFAGSTMSNDTHHSGDRFLSVKNPMPALDEGFMYAFVSHQTLAAGLWTNSQYSHGGKTEDYTRTTAKKQTIGQTNYIGIEPSPWIYQTAYGKLVNPAHTLELPQAKVVVTQDLNEDGKVDWQDGAIAYRDIMHVPFGAEKVSDLVAHRISMNFGSQAQNPFLTSLDEIKKVWLNTDGLGQSIILKGYGNEGHDSGHLNYKDIGQRMGGVEDFQYLLKESKQFGADIGLHVNVSETYTESPYFTEEILRKNKAGDFHYGWNWLDQGINIDSAYDLAHGRFERFKDLKEIVQDDLDFIYVDVWGNHQSGDERAWQTHQIATELNQLGWSFALEWGFAGEYDAIFHHWAADLPYGGYAFKGINSMIARFIRNHQKDAWIAHYPKYGGAALTPLLGGYELNDFEGWQGRSDYRAYIRNLFRINLPTKFIQHFQVVEVNFGDTVEMTDNGETYQWTPEMYVRLQDKDGRELEIRRLSNDVTSPEYQMREIRLDGRVILKDESYLLPWSWDNTNKYYYYSARGPAGVSGTDTRLSTTTATDEETAQNSSVSKIITDEILETTNWELADDLADRTFYIYELSQTGKINKRTAHSHGNHLTLTLPTNTAFVIYLEPQELPEVNWSSGSHLVDTGFNSASLNHWEIKGSSDAVSIVKSQGDNPMLKMEAVDEAVSIRQAITDLKANTQYALYVGLDNRSDAEASLAVELGNGVTISNTAGSSLAKNYVKADPHNTLLHNSTVDDSSYFQNFYVYFTTGDDVSDVSVRLERAAGTGATYWDNLRVVENNAKLFDGTHETPISVTHFTQDFENVAQGIFPFVIAEAEGVEDNRIHLSQANAPYTERGWHDRKIADVISGDWSLKVNGLVSLDKMLFHTIPQNIHFEAGQSYKVSFDYEAGLDDHYAFVVGNGEVTSDRSAWSIHPLKNTWTDGQHPHHVSIGLTAGKAGDSWIGILSTDKKLDAADSQDRDYNFKSYKDFVLDNLVIEKI